MPRTCIICGGGTGSREHIFPAALGGRRTNRGIYCGTHNNALSSLANTIAQQLRFLNALLAVRPDHSDQAQPFEYTSPKGERFCIFDGLVTRVGTASTNAQQGMHMRFTFGGPEGLQAIAYIALTFFAHYFPNEARQPSLDPLKSFVKGETTENAFAWWTHDSVAQQLPSNPFEFGHTIVLTTVASTGEASAAISFFGGLHFGVALGRVPSAVDSSIVVFIDPQCDHPPNDIQVVRSDGTGLAQTKPEPLQAHLERMVHEGTAHRGLQQLIARIEEWRFRRDMIPVQAKLNALRRLPIWTRQRGIEEIVSAESRRVFRLMRYVAHDFAATRSSNKANQFVGQMLSRMVELDPTSASGLTALAHAAAVQAGAAIVHELDGKLAREDVDMDYLWMLFSGGPGAAHIANAMFAPIFTALDRAGID